MTELRSCRTYNCTTTGGLVIRQFYNNGRSISVVISASYKNKKFAHILYIR